MLKFLNILIVSAILSKNHFGFCMIQSLYDPSNCNEDNYCDGKVDCANHTDELDCLDMDCEKDAFKCNYGACIDGDLKCDGKPDCKDNSDETHPDCRQTDIFCLKSSCTLPKQPHCGYFNISGCHQSDISRKCHKVFGTVVPEGTILKYGCNNNYHVSDQSEYVRVCIKCKWTPERPISCISTGTSTVPNHPWHASIYEGSNRTRICGGTIVSPNMILSAAHCFDKNTTYRVVVGKTYISLDNCEESEQIFKVKNIYKISSYEGHPNYRYDVAMVELEYRILFGEAASSVSIGGSTNLISKRTGSKCWQVFTQTDTLSQVDVEPIINHECKEIFRDITSFQFETFCGSTDKILSTGDSGSGLILTNSITNKHFIEGVLSFKTPSTHWDRNYAGYTNISMEVIMDFIMKYLKI